MLAAGEASRTEATEADATAAWPPQGGSAATPTEGGGAEGEGLPFLAPPTKPGSLGRLGHYEVQGIIGRGGFGIVLRAFDEKLHRVVAVKVLAPAYAVIGSARERFIREARAAAAVKNEHVVAIYQVQDEEQPPYLVMELIDGITLQKKLDRKGALPIKEILRIGMQTAEGLAAAHRQGLIHRDIKPANILLENGVERVRITDFGLARAVDDASVSQSGTVAGTPMYMSPEQAEGLVLDPRSDLFSLGSVLYAMCTGHPPFRASGTHAVLKRVIEAAPRPIREVNSEIPDWLAALIARLHAREPKERFQTAQEVAELLGQYLADVQAGRTPRGSNRAEGPAPLRSRRSWLRRVAVGAALLAGLAVLGFVLLRRGSPGNSQTAPGQTEPPTFVGIFGGPDWRPLYDGKSYAGWEAFGNSNAGAGEFLLFPGGAVDTLDRMPANFHLRMEVNLLAGQGTVRFHAQARPQEANPPYPKDGWFLNFIELAPGQVNAELHARSPAAAGGPVNTAFGGTVAECRKWFYLEIITRDDGTRVRVNGRDCMTAGGKVTPGVLSLWNTGRGNSQIAFRKIEIKDLTPAAAAPPLAVAPFDAAGAKEHQETWASHLGVPVEIENSIGMKLRLIPAAGEFMTLTDNPEKNPPRRVAVPQPFYLGLHEVTVGQFKKFAAETGYKTDAEKKDNGEYWDRRRGRPVHTPGLHWRNPPFAQSNDHPVCLVSWNDARSFCEWLSLKEGRSYRLPSEAQWEYACRAGAPTIGLADPAGANLKNPAGTVKVGSYAPNAFGLFDMLGNVHEWCDDVPGAGDRRVRRGGGYSSGYTAEALIGKGNDTADRAYAGIGFRVALVGLLKAKARAEPGWGPLFNGKNLAGWEGLPGLWKVEGQDVIGSANDPKGVFLNTFLVSKKKFTDFEVRFQVRLRGEQGNSGLQIRSKLASREDFAVHGPQIDIGRGVWSYLYQEGPRGRFLAQAPSEVVARTIRPLGFNDFHIRCVGKHLTVKFNGDTTIDGEFPDLPAEGVLALQLLREGPMEVTFRNMEIKELPPPPKPRPAGVGG
jgi:serine/threonine-protein kinase